MNIAPIPENELERLAALHQFQILDTEAEQEFDDIVELASQLCEVPISLVCFVDEKRQWFKAKCGLKISEINRDVAFCSYAINQQDLMVVADASKDERFFDNPFVTTEPHIRFYAGMPLVTDEGLVMGTLCVIDRKPRTLTSQQTLAMRVLAKNVIALLKLRKTKKELSSILSVLPIIFFRLNKHNIFTYCHTSNPQDLLMRMDQFLGKRVDDALPPELAQLTNSKIEVARKSGKVEIYEYSLPVTSGLSWFEARVLMTINNEVLVIISNITTTKKSEEEKTKSIQFFQTITNNVPAMISHWTADLRNTFTNENYLRWYEKSKEEILGINLKELTGEENFQQIKPFVEEVLKGKQQDFQFPRVRKNEMTYLRAQYVPNFHQGKVVGFYSFISDITPMKQAEVVIQKERELSDSIINSLPGIFYLFDDKRKIIRWNKNLEEVSGYDAEEIKKMHPEDFMVADEKAKFNESIEITLSESLPGVSITLLTKENKRIPYHLNTHRIIYEGISCILGIGMDISGQVYASQELQKALNELTHYRQALNESSIIAITDNKGIITYVNKNFLKISKYRSDELVGNTHRIVNSGYHSKQFFKDLWKTISKGNTWNGQIKNMAKDGTFYWVDTTIVPFKKEAGKPSHYLAVRRDITARKISEEALHKSEANLKTVFENTDTSFILLNANLEIVSFNQTAQLLFERYMGEKLMVGYHANHYLLDKTKYLLEALAGKNVVNIEDYSRNPINDFWLFERYMPVYDEQKMVTGLIISFSDISIVKKAELVIKENEQQLTNILNNMVGGIVKTDTRGNVTYINEVAKQILGLDHDSFVDFKSIFDIFQPFDDEGMPMTAEAFPVTITLDQNTRIANSKVGILIKSDVKKWISLNSSPVYNKNGQLEGALCSFVDITESVETQNKLMAVSSRLLLAKQLTGMGIWDWNMEANKLTWDDQMFDLTGLDKGTEPTLSLFYSRIHQDDVEKAKRKMEEFTKNGGDDVFRFVHNDKSIRYLRIIVVTHKKKDKPISILGVISDITNIIVQEQDIMKANQKISEMQQVALRAAMNPHFLYNALNSIQFFITHNDRPNALNYLSKFSKLVRGILDGSMNKFTKLSNELDLLRHYIEIEQIRFINKFEYIIHIEDNLEADNFEIPSLLMQPYVENAILHGLYNKEGSAGLLKVTIRCINKLLIIFIEDNGIGRVAAAKLKKKNFPNYQSKGIQITEERIKLIDDGTISISSNIVDLYDREKPIGTRVIIKIKES